MTPETPAPTPALPDQVASESIRLDHLGDVRRSHRCGDPRTDMWACDERCIAQQQGAPEHESRRLQVENRLKEELLRSMDSLGNLRGEQAICTGPCCCKHVTANQRRWDRQPMLVPGLISAKIRENVDGVGWAIPHEIHRALSRLPIVANDGNRIGQQHFAIREAKRVTVKERCMGRR